MTAATATAPTTEAPPTPNRADLLLMVISAVGELRPHVTLQELNSVLKYLANEFHPEMFIDYRDATRQRALTETLAYLDQNNLVSNTLLITRTGTARIAVFSVLKDSVHTAVLLRYLVKNFTPDQQASPN